MKKFLLATHGEFAKGIKNSVQIIAGEIYSSQLLTITAYLDESDYTNDIRMFIDSISKNDQGFIFTDLYGGSVNQKVTQTVIASKKPIVVISGMNLGMLLELLLNTSDPLTEEDIERAVTAGKEDMKFPVQNANEDELQEDSFFQ